MTAPSRPLRRNRDFQLLWFGQVVSDLGLRISGVAVPLLVLVLTDSPAKTGFVGFTGTLPILVLMLPAGALVDRWDRKRTMLASDAACCLALGSVAVALWADRLTFAQLVVVSIVEGTAWTFFSVAERSALRSLVPTEQLPAAVAQNQAREYGALLAGSPIGGALFALARWAPFVADAVSYLVSIVALLLIRAPLQEARRRVASGRLVSDIREGFAWLWRQPFLRTASLLVIGSDLTVNALYLVVIVAAREHGASSSLIGLLVAFIGVGGVLGALVAPRVVRRLSPRAAITLTLWTMTILLPAIAFVPYPLVIGVLYGAMFVPYPSWSAVVQSYRATIVPDRLQGRVQSVASLFSLGAVPLGSLAVGLLLEWLGVAPTTLLLFAAMVVVAGAATLSRPLRNPPPLERV